MRRGARTVAVIAIAMGIGPIASPVHAEGERAATRERMQAIFADFVLLLGRASDAGDFASPSSRSETLAALRRLARQADALEGGSLTAAHGSVRRSLADDAIVATDAFAEGRFEGARFLIHQMVEDCFGCHSKLPSDRRFALGARLLEEPAVLALAPERRAGVAVAARQFEQALELYEQVMHDPARPARRVASSGIFESYLKVALRVRDDRARVVRELGRFLERRDLPIYLSDEIGAWVEAVRELPSDASPASALADARRAVREGQLRTHYPGDRRGLVHFVWASRRLHRWVQAGEADPGPLAEGFYLLGLCETHISPSLWLSEAEDFLETAIRSDPASPHARRAYATLEAVWIEGYTGSGGTHLPAEVARRLDSLRQLVEEAPASLP